MIIRCIDFETCGLTPKDGGIVEIGWTDLSLKDDGTIFGISGANSHLCNPGCPIPPAASAVHHWVDEDVADKPPSSDLLPELLVNADIFCAHNAKYERQYWEADKPFICTQKVAYHLAPNAPGHKLQVLRYWLKLKVDKVLAFPPHNAGPDTHVCAHLLARMLAKISIAEMIDISSRPALLPKFRFGKHADLPLSDVPHSYLEWILTQDFDEDTKYTANHYLKL